MEDINMLLQNIPDEYYPYYSWIWNDKLEKDEIVRQLIKMREADIKNIYIISESQNFRPGFMPTYAEPEYLSDEYMEFFAFAVKEAEKLGMHVWIYDEDGWPSGSCAGRTAKTRENLRIKEFEAKNGGYALKDVSGEKFYPNLMLCEAAESFIEETHEKYKVFCGSSFGKTVTGVFTDEPHIDFSAYDEKIAESFEKRYGYKIDKYLKEGFCEDDNPKARADWREHCSHMFAENYFGTVKNWCNKNGLLFTGHVNLDHTGEFVNSCGNILEILRKFDIPGVDVIFRQINPDKEGETVFSLGNDFGKVLTCENKFFPRFASSAAQQTGAVRALAECFAVYGAMRYNKMRYVINFLIARRINLINIMSVSYGKRGHVCAGMRPNFIAEAPDYFGLKKMNDYIAAECFLMSLGKAEVKTALYMPVRRWWKSQEEMENGSKKFFEFGRKMEECGADFEIIDDYAICSGGISPFDSIYICGGTLDSESVKIKLESYISGGGKVYSSEKTNIKGAVLIKESNPSEEILPASDIFEKNKDLRISVRDLDGGEKIIFVYNEGFQKTTLKINPLKDKRLYEIDIIGKKLYNTYENERVVLQSGESRFYYLTENSLRGCERPELNTEIVPRLEKAVIISQFEVKDSVISVKEKNEPLKDKLWPGNDFSGQVCYNYKFRLNESDLKRDVFLEIEDVNNCCSVNVNREHVGEGIFFPLMLKIPKELLHRENFLDITVGNTVAEKMVKLTSDGEYIYGPYHHMARAFEKESVGGGILGNIKIKLRRE